MVFQVHIIVGCQRPLFTNSVIIILTHQKDRCNYLNESVKRRGMCNTDYNPRFKLKRPYKIRQSGKKEV